MVREVKSTDRKAVAAARALLTEIHPDWKGDAEMADTPARLVGALREMTEGYEPLGKLTKFPTKFDGILTRSGISFKSLCAHHTFGYEGRAWIAYIPKGWKLGISKFTKLVQHYSRRFTSQEELTVFLADQIEEAVAPEGFCIVLSAYHTCETMRGARADPVPTTTAIVRGLFRDKPELELKAYRLFEFRPEGK